MLELGGSSVRVLSTYCFLPWLLSVGGAAFIAQNLAAQDVAITNARIIVGNGTVVPSGTIIVRGGKIVSAGPSTASTQGLKIIDAKGMSALPGFIDAHKHINTGPNEKEQMQSLLESRSSNQSTESLDRLRPPLA